METKIRATALAMVLTGVYGLGVTILAILWKLLMPAPTQDELHDLHLPPAVERYLFEASRGPGALDIAWGLLTLAAMAFVIFGGIRLYQLRQRSVVFTSAIILLIPCLSPCCLSCGLSIGVGVWSLIVLLDPQVKAAFKP